MVVIVVHSVKVGCKKSMDCFKKHSDGNFISDACGLANCLGICIPDGMCKGKYDRPVNDSDCKGCPKYINEMPRCGYTKKKN